MAVTTATTAGAGAGVATARRQAPRRRALALALAVLALGLLWGLGSVPLLSKNEGRRAAAIAAMFQDGNWIIPHLNGVPYLEKPPLYYWVGTAIAHLRGQADEWAARLPSALAMLAVLGFATATLARLAGRRAGIYTALVLLTAVGISGVGRRGHLEGLLTALCAGSLFAAARYLLAGGTRAWLDLSYALLGMAVLTKGPVALVFVTPPLLATALHLREPRAWQALAHWRGWAICVLLGGGWYAAVVAQLGIDAFAQVAQKDLAGKIYGGSADPVYTYIVWLARDFAPWSLLLLAAPWRSVRAWLGTRHGVLLFYAVLVPVLVLMCCNYKHAKYLFPAYPAFAALLALRLEDARTRLPAARRHWPMRAGLVLVATLVGYRAVLEPRVFAHNYTGLRALAASLRAAPQPPLYAWREVDARLLYYYAAPIPVVHDAGALRALAARGPLRVVVTGERRTELPADLPWCSAGEFSPYLKRRQTALVLGIGAACPAVPVRPVGTHG